MYRIIWDESFSVGVSKFDKQHKQIISIINTLNDQQNEGFDSKKVAKILNELTIFVHTHFKMEEQLLAEYGYPNISDQQKEHKEFRIKLANFCTDSMTAYTSIPINVLHYLKEWWVDHILVKDMQYRSFLTSRGVR